MNISIEIFPPKTLEGEEVLKKNLQEISSIQPRFISVTCGASGNRNVQNFNICKMITELKLSCVAHLICQGFSKQEIKERIGRYQQMGINSVLALRGDALQEATDTEQQLTYAKDLNNFIHQHYPDINIYNAGYPQGHQDNSSQENDFQHQLNKLQTHSKGVITQLFFDNSKFIQYHCRLREAGYKGEIIAGIFPITQVAQITKISSMCGIFLPKKLTKNLYQYQDDPKSILQIGIDYAVEQCLELTENGLHNYHLYSMNQSEHIIEIHRQLKQHSSAPQLTG